MELLRPLLTLAVVSLFVVDVRAKLKGDECEGVLLPFHYNADPNRAFFRIVCINFLNKLVGKMKAREVTVSDHEIVEVELMKACKDAKGKDSSFVSLLIPPLPECVC